MIGKVLLGLLILILSGCILNGYEKPPAKLTSAFSGAISLVDVTGVSEEGEVVHQANISGRFQTHEKPKPQGIRRFPLNLQKGTRAVQCQLFTSENGGDSRAEVEKGLSVGPLFLGTPTSSQEIQIPEVQQGIYQKELLPHYSPGIYLLRAQGVAQKNAFQIDFSMPEELREPKVNSHGLLEGPAVVQKSADFLLEIEPATAPNDLNIIEMSLITQTPTEERVLVCGALESQLETVNGKTQMKVPSAQLSGLLATPSGAIQILRVNALGGVVQNGPTLTLEGLRAWVWPSLVAE